MSHHADFSRKLSLAETREDAYEQVLDSLKALVADQTNWVANLSNASSLLWNLFNADGDHVNWAGFYVVDPLVENQLILGPFHGQVACQTIQLGKGVCGVAAKTKKTQLVPNVELFPGHIACDGETKSEIVVPIIDVESGELYGVIDIDSTNLNEFGPTDVKYLEEYARILAVACKW